VGLERGDAIGVERGEGSRAWWRGDRHHVADRYTGALDDGQRHAEEESHVEGSVAARWVYRRTSTSEIAIIPSKTMRSSVGRNASIFVASSTMHTMMGRSDDVSRGLRW